jgi:CRISPR-associated exonuclease Cas4
MWRRGNKMYLEEEYLQLSGIQHFVFCKRQWALINVEHQWQENYRTMDGRLMHENAHKEEYHEKRGDIIITRGMAIFSPSLGLSGKCDVVEFHKDEKGVVIYGWEEKWVPFPVEYKRGEPKQNNCDILQLCAQAMCFEEMLLCEIPEGALFYGEPRRRLKVIFTKELRDEVKKATEEMHRLYKREHTPKVKTSQACRACSLKEACLPVLLKNQSVEKYLKEKLCEDS